MTGGTLSILAWPVAGIVAGLVVGSFLATLVLRWGRGEGLAGRSRCDACGVTLGVADLVPILSWAMARGRCRRCGALIDWRHPVIEGAAAAVAALSLLAAPGWAGVAGALFGWILIALMALDIEHLWLPDRLTLPLLAGGLALGPGTLVERLALAAGVGAALFLLRSAHHRLRGRHGLGLGDVKLGAAIAAWLPAVLIGPFFLLAALVGLGLSTAVGVRQGWQALASVRLPFGAAMATAAFPLWLLAADFAPA